MALMAGARCTVAAGVEHAAAMQLLHATAALPPRRRWVACAASRSAEKQPIDVGKEAHKIFDEVVVTIRSGDGGNGEIVETGRGKYVRNYKYNPGGNQPKQIWLPASAPADGADGADVVLVCDPRLDSLLHLHRRKTWAGARGAQGNPAVGSAGPKRNTGMKKAETQPLEIPVPPGTVVRRKSSGVVLGELLQPGERLLLAKGGKGGVGVRAPSRLQKQRDLQRELRTAEKLGGEVVAVEDVNWRDDAHGLPGMQLTVQLLLRVVADVGIVGFPNAGKSSLLAALTRASPEVAPYPFTTLMPNLGVMQTGEGAVLADLPGLIEGAHTGRGLGRMFLRHLRRTRLLLHVVDASAADPATDYLAVREELRMYNPAYVTRPHVVALNKMDLEDAGALRQEVTDEVLAAAQRLREDHPDAAGATLPTAIVACSAVSGEGVTDLAAELQAALRDIDSSETAHDARAGNGLRSSIAAAVSAALTGEPLLPSDGPVGPTAAGTLNSGGSSSSSSGSSSSTPASVPPAAAPAAAPAPEPAAEPEEGDSDEPLPPVDSEDAWLFELSEEDLLALADGNTPDEGEA